MVMQKKKTSLRHDYQSNPHKCIYIYICGKHGSAFFPKKKTFDTISIYSDVIRDFPISKVDINI